MAAAVAALLCSAAAEADGIGDFTHTTTPTVVTPRTTEGPTTQMFPAPPPGSIGQVAPQRAPAPPAPRIVDPHARHP